MGPSSDGQTRGGVLGSGVDPEAWPPTRLRWKRVQWGQMTTAMSGGFLLSAHLYAEGARFEPAEVVLLERRVGGGPGRAGARVDGVVLVPR